NRIIPLVAEAGFKNLICFTGNTPEGMDNEAGMRNFETGIKPLLRNAERHGVVLCLEMFNTRVDHPGYMANSTRWGVEMCDRLGSENFKLLYDIYHMQIMEGDIISRIREFGDYFAHYHTAGVPGRNEIDESQELNYPAIMRAIVETGFDGFVGQEFIPTGVNALAALREGIEICDV
ncbi:MAG: hydroxypyruvate isomerase family protein, partial [Balneolaceae bacterium]